MYTARCEVKPGGSQRRHERWRRIALEAAKQTGRATLMEIFSPAPLDEVIEGIRPGTAAIFFSERSGAGFGSIRPAPEMTAFFGPKGGWEDSELEMASAAWMTIVTFGGRITRAETAAIAMTAILQHRFGDLA
jgi:16S rRNA (uracil1498-N3)-methyltransferase